MSSAPSPDFPDMPDIPDEPEIPVPEQRSVSTRKKAPDPNAPPTHGMHLQEMDLPKLPHERDESVDMTDGIPSAEMQQAYRDLERGLVDTDAGLEAYNVGKPGLPGDPAQAGAPKPAEPKPQ